MLHKDKQIGRPQIPYQDTEANLNNLNLTSSDKGCISYATDTDKFLYWDGDEWAEVGGNVPDASTTEKGIVELATDTEAQTGTATNVVITPANLRSDVPATPAASRGVRLDASGHLMLPALGDIYPDADGRGLMTRLINGGIAYDEHFRGADTIPTGYAWQGSPFAAPTTATYNHLSDFLYIVTPTSSRAFISRAVTNAAANWQNKALYGRFTCGSNGRIGLRFDDGTDNNYAQVFVDGTANDGTETLKFQYRDGGGAVVTNASTILLPAFTFVILRLFMYWTGTQYQAIGYLLAPEIGRSLNITGFGHVLTWAPAAGRAGVFVENPSGSGANPLYCDWFKNELV